ncbi:MAG: N-6 DNA methylase [Chloroflexota bacterium]|nr:N-6 DNA methylase [Rhodospirillaceae bacterium]MDE2960414.1 N-6 DNA methylase [Chloroflexota bacterium]
MTNPFFWTKSPTPDSHRYLAEVGEDHRKRFGQYFTHQGVAKFMVDWALGSGYRSLYDPGFGLGAFYTSAADKDYASFTASEVDPMVLDYWEKSTGHHATFIAREDYLLSWGKKHTNIVCNPPYMRFQKFLNRDAVFAAFAKNAGLRLSGYTNTASAFLLKSLSELDGKGRLAYIMPLEFLNTGYGKLVKSKLIEGGHLAAIIKLDCEKEIFPDAITSVGIVLYDAAVHHRTVSFYSVNTIDALPTLFESEPVARVPAAELSPGSKWLQYCAANSGPLDTGSLILLDNYGRFTRGIATGANKFFVLSRTTARAAQLDNSEYVPCLTRSAQVKRTVFSSTDYEHLLRDDAPVLLFSVGANHSSGAERYIKIGEASGYHKRFLTKNRTPWYKTEFRNPAPILMGVFSRGGYKVIRNRSDAVNLSCFHGFHPNMNGQHYLDHLFLYFASRPGRSVMALSMRKYGDALDKFEPNDLNHALVPSEAAFERLGNSAVEHAIGYVEENDCVPDYINDFFGEIVNA